MTEKNEKNEKNESTQERYEPDWSGETPDPGKPGDGRRWRRFMALRIGIGAAGLGVLTWGVWSLWGAPAAAVLLGFASLRIVRFGHHARWHHRMHGHGFHGHHGPGFDGHHGRAGRTFRFGCGGHDFFGPPFRQQEPMV